MTRCARNCSWMPWTTTWCPSDSTADRPQPAGRLFIVLFLCRD